MANRNGMTRAGLIGAGKMGISHLAVLGAHEGVEVAAVCDSMSYATSVLRKHTGIETFGDHRKMIDSAGLDCVVVATPTATHFEAASYALERGLHVFVEKPLCLRSADSARLAELAAAQRRANQVGYHNRFVGTFREARRLVRAGALGDLHHVSGRAYGQVVIRPKTGGTWRARKSEGGGCLHDYASHVVDLMNFVVGPPAEVRAAHLSKIFSKDVEDSVYALFSYPGGASGILETNWSDESYRKMSTSLEVHGTRGKLIADRQELKVYLRPGVQFDPYGPGWTLRYATELQPPVAFYVRGEEYSAQIDAFIGAVRSGNTEHESSFASAAQTDCVIDLILEAA